LSLRFFTWYEHLYSLLKIASCFVLQQGEHLKRNICFNIKLNVTIYYTESNPFTLKFPLALFIGNS